MLKISSQDKLGKTEALKALERCASLILDDELPKEAGHKYLVRIFEAAVGRPPGSFKANTTIPMGAHGSEAPAHRVSLVRGVVLNLDANMRLVSATVTPRKVRERKEMLKIAGIGHDPASDVSVRHDDYLAEQSPHATS